MQSRSVRRVDPNDWAAKKKAAIEKAKQLREERAHTVDENHTFQPTVNKRPQYLNKGGAMSDSLDQISGGSRPAHLSDDIFEQPLPGAKAGVPSPNSDALGHEMRRQNSNKSDSAGPYKSKFMQQFEQQPPVQQYDEAPPARSRADVEAEDTFMSMLRGNEKKKSSAGPGWNDDFSSGGFGEPPPVRNRAPRQRTNPQPAPSQPAPSRARPDWNMDTETPPRIATSPRGDVPRPQGDVSHARSRLALLKSKMNKRSDSSELRSTSAGDATYATSQSFNVEPQRNTMATDRVGRRVTRQDSYEEPSRMTMQEEQQIMSKKSDKVQLSPRYEPSAYEPPRRIPPPKQQPVPAQHRQVKRPEPYQEPPEVPPVRSRPAPQPPQQPSISQPPVAFNIGDEYAEVAPAGEQMECPDCGRKFNPIPYEKHIKICAKVFLQKRKAFDSAKMRIEAIPELVEIKTKEKRMGTKKKPVRQAAPAAEERPINAEKKAKWKEQSNAFREAMKAARQYSEAVKTGAPLPPPPVASAPDPSLILCDNCGRRFNEKAAERHIPQCKNIRAKPKALMRGSGGGGGVNGTQQATAQNIMSNPTKKPSAMPKPLTKKR